MSSSPLEDGVKSFTEPVADLVHTRPITNRVGDVGFGQDVFDISVDSERDWGVKLFVR